MTQGNIQVYLSIFENILENIQRICQLRPIVNGHVRLSVHPSRQYMTGFLLCLSYITTLEGIRVSVGSR